MTKEFDEKMRVLRNGGFLMKGRNRCTCVKNGEITMFIKSFYSQIRTSQNEIPTPQLLSVALCVDRNPLFPFVWTI
jgi:hypothetical protein